MFKVSAYAGLNRVSSISLPTRVMAQRSLKLAMDTMFVDHIYFNTGPQTWLYELDVESQAWSWRVL